MVKSLFDISWQVDEPTYRADPALSQSTLTKFERDGFSCIDKLGEKQKQIKAERAKPEKQQKQKAQAVKRGKGEQAI